MHSRFMVSMLQHQPAGPLLDMLPRLVCWCDPWLWRLQVPICHCRVVLVPLSEDPYIEKTILSLGDGASQLDVSFE